MRPLFKDLRPSVSAGGAHGGVPRRARGRRRGEAVRVRALRAPLRHAARRAHAHARPPWAVLRALPTWLRGCVSLPTSISEKNIHLIWVAAVQPPRRGRPDILFSNVV